MKRFSDPYGIESMKAREKAESERKEKFDLLMEQISEQLNTLTKEAAITE